MPVIRLQMRLEYCDFIDIRRLLLWHTRFLMPAFLAELVKASAR